MEFSNHKFKLFDFIKISFIVSPLNASIKIVEMILSAVSPSFLVLNTAKFIDVAIGIHSGNYPYHHIYMPILALFALIAYQNISKVLLHFSDIKLSFAMNEYIQSKIIYKRALLDYCHIENNDDWELIVRACNNPSTQLLEGYNNLIQMIRLIITLASYTIILLSQVWWSALIIVTFTIPLFFLSLKSGKNNYKGYQRASKYQRRAGYLNSVLEDRQFTEERALFSFTNEIEKRWLDQYETSRKITLSVQAKELLKTKGAGLLTVIISFVFAGILLFPLRQAAISIGFFIAIVTALFNVVNIVSWELTSIANSLANKHEYLKDLSKFFALSVNENSDALPDVSIRNKIDSTIEFQNVSFAYPGTERLVLKNISFKLNNNMKYAFVGANGAGKTTIIKLLTGLYTNYEGKILIGGRDIRSLNESKLKAIFAVIYQDFSKYQISVLDNICLGRINDNAQKQVEPIVKSIGIDKAIERLPNGMNTKLGKIYENSVDISGGEWQRIAMARTLLSGAPVYILDEPTAALDPIAESELYDNFRSVMEDNHLTILITHRLGAVRFTDEILVIEDGTVVEHGNHNDLVSQLGVYSKMFEEQKGWYKYEK
jgi:ATP-binding cassette subfamily B protein